MKLLPKILTKTANITLIWLPIIITFSLSDTDVLPFCNNTHSTLKENVCEQLNNNSPYASKNFLASFVFMILPTFVMLNLEFFPTMSCSYEAFETLFFNCILVYKTTAGGLFYGFSIHGSDLLDLSSVVWMGSFVVAKTLSKIPTTDTGSVFAFWTIFISYVSLFDPFMIGIENECYSVLLIIVLEIAYSKWQERRNMPIPFITASLILFGFSSLFTRIEHSSNVQCDKNSNFQWKPAARTLEAIALFSYFIGFRKQEKRSNLVVQNRFEEVNQRSDDDQLI